MSVSDLDKPEVVALAQGYYDAGFTIVATGKTYELIKENGIPVEKIKKIHEGRPNITDALTNGDLAMVINTPNEYLNTFKTKQNKIQPYIAVFYLLFN